MADNNNVKFEDAISRLDAIVASLEGGKCELDESLKLFEEGVALVKVCTERLDSATAKVKKVTDGGIEDFQKTEEEK